MDPKTILDDMIDRYPCLASVCSDVFKAYELIAEACRTDSCIMSCGNGGSAADSEHIVGELMKGFRRRRPLSVDQKDLLRKNGVDDIIIDSLQTPIRAVSLVSQSALISAVANDNGADYVFAQQLLGYSTGKNDVLISLSTSGNSVNVVNAAKVARALGVRVVSIIGSNKESSLYKLSDVCICLPADSVYEIQELTLPVYHALCAMTESKFFSE